MSKKTQNNLMTVLLARLGGGLGGASTWSISKKRSGLGGGYSTWSTKKRRRKKK